MDYFLGQSGVTRLASDLKTKFQALFAAISHTHNAATDLIGQVPIANGGTGASTQADAQVALDIAPKDSAAHTVGEIETMVSGLTSKTGVDGMTVGEDDLHTQIQTLQDSVNGKTPYVNIGACSGIGDAWDKLTIYDRPVIVSFSYSGQNWGILYKYSNAKYGMGIAQVYYSLGLSILSVNNGTKTIKSITSS